MKRYLVLEDGSFYEGEALGSNCYSTGELVFNTSMTGYQEILTDNSYCGQIVMMTYPLIGNYGINRDDNESLVPAVFGFVMRDYCPFPSNFREEMTLDAYMKDKKIPGIFGVDTRAITKKIRSMGTLKASFCDTEEEIPSLVEQLKKESFLHDQVERVSTRSMYPIPGRGKKVVMMDFGVKLSIQRELAKRDCDLVEVIETIKKLIPHTVVFGICLGCQLIALSQGAKTYKLKFGHRGANHPVVNLETGRTEITSQNHGFAVDIDSLEGTDLVMSHRALNDGSCEGVRHTKYPCFAVQYHPEANAGPQDSTYLFDKFIEMMDKENAHA